MRKMLFFLLFLSILPIAIIFIIRNMDQEYECQIPDDADWYQSWSIRI